MAARSSSRIALRFTVYVAIPIGIAVILNAIVRPTLAAQLGGSRRQHFTNFRSSDGWWEFDAATRDAHPVLTRFLELSDGALAMMLLVVAAAIAVTLLLFERRRAVGELTPYL